MNLRIIYRSPNTNRATDMKSEKRLLCLFLVFGVLPIILMSQQAEAALGGYADPIEADRKVFLAEHRSTRSSSGYTVEQIDLNGTLIREYISPSRIVFGIAWNGLTHPDLTQLLGSYAGQYQEALKKTPRKHGRRHIQIKTDLVVVEKWGHLRNLQGRAYAPDLIPPGVTIDEIN